MDSRRSNITYNSTGEMSCLPNDFASMYEYTPDQIVTITTVMPLMLALGLITNGAFLFVVFQIKSMSTITNRYLSSLANADISYLLVRNLQYLIPYLTVPVFYSEQYVGRAGCLLLPLLVDVTFFMSLAMVTIVSLDRFYAVHKPQENRFRYTRKFSRVIIASSWGVCLVVAGIFQIPSGGKLSTFEFCDDWGNKSDTHPAVFAECIPYRGQFTSVARVCMTIPFFLSMIINFVLYVRIIYLLNRRAGSTEVGKKSNQQTRNRITIMLVITGVLFFLLFAPYEISILIIQTIDMQGENAPTWWQSPEWDRWYEVCKILVCILHIVNPIIYNATNRRYREAFARAFCLHDIIYRVRQQQPPGNSYKAPSSPQTDMTVMDTTQNEVVRLHCFDGAPKSSQCDVEEDSGD